MPFPSLGFIERIPGLNKCDGAPQPFNENDRRYKFCCRFQVAKHGTFLGALATASLALRLLLIFSLLPLPKAWDVVLTASELCLSQISLLLLVVGLRRLRIGTILLCIISGVILITAELVALTLAFTFANDLVPFRLTSDGAPTAHHKSLLLNNGTKAPLSPLLESYFKSWHPNVALAVTFNVIFIAVARILPAILTAQFFMVILKAGRYVKDKAPLAKRSESCAAQLAGFKLLWQEPSSEK